jgi:uncharacterized membrane protein YjfL (UPF0719 family)
VTRWKAAAGLLTVALLALGPALVPTVAAARAAADPIGDPVPQKDGGQALRLEVDTMTPRVITSGTPKLTVTGRITNTGDRRVDDIQVKVQRDEPVESDAQLRDLSDLDFDSASSPFVDVTGKLDRGDSVQFKVTVAVRGAEQSLALSQPGVYPTLVNVNGKQEYSGRARLAAVALPLPVLSVPGGAAAKRKPAPPGLTFLWPILDTQPRRLPTTDGQVVLADDTLADSLSVSGRLFGLVNSVSVATAADSTLLHSMCFAVDPDLLQTVEAMTHGYKVRTASGATVAGRGATVAKEWLTRLQELTHGQCVISVPFADADLVALSRSGAFDLSSLAIGSSTVVAQLLTPVQPVKDLYWPAGGTLDQRTLVDVTAGGPATVLADPSHLRSAKGKAPYEVTGLQTAHPVRAVPIDPLLSGTLTPARGTGGLQDGMAALVFRTMFDPRASDQLVVAPPRRWTASVAELGIYLDLAQQLLGDGYATSQSLSQLTSGASRGTTVGLTYVPQDTAQEVPRAVTTDVVRINGTRRDLLNAMDDDNTTNVDPNQLLSPIQYGLLRGVSTAWRGHPERASAWVEYVDQQVAALCGRVVVKDAGRPLTLASGDSPIPVHVYNGLPVAMIVRIHLTATAGLRPVAVTDIRIPPQSSRSQYIAAEVIRAGRFTLDASLSTRGGTQLGSTVRMEATSTSVGVITVAITGVAGGVLVLLVMIRLFRRVRAARAGSKDGTKDEVAVDA